MTASEDNTARVWDVARTEAAARERDIVITAALARGIGRRTKVEAADLLMKDAPEDLYAAACRQLLDPAKYSAEEIAARERALEETIAALHAPLHPNCYLSPTQFAEKFGLKTPGKAAPEGDNREADAGSVKAGLKEDDGETGGGALAVEAAAAIAGHSAASSPSPRRPWYKRLL